MLESSETCCVLHNKDEWHSWCLGLPFQTKWSNTQHTGMRDLFLFMWVTIQSHLYTNLVLITIICYKGLWRSSELSPCPRSGSSCGVWISCWYSHFAWTVQWSLQHSEEWKVICECGKHLGCWVRGREKVKFYKTMGKCWFLDVWTGDKKGKDFGNKTSWDEAEGKI